MNLKISETFVNLDKGHRFGETGVYESAYDSRGDLFRACAREYGRCTSTVRVEPTEKAVGWCFVKRVEYEDADRIRDSRKRTYLREVWVTIHEEE